MHGATDGARYGPTPKATVYFNADQPPEQLDIETFTQRYTIDPANMRQDGSTTPFAHVSHAVIHYPLSLLENGVEIVDSPVSTTLKR